MDPQLKIILLVTAVLILFVVIISVGIYIGIRRLPANQARMEAAIAKSGYEGPAELKRLLPADERRRQSKRVRAALIAIPVSSFAAGLLAAWHQQWLLIAGIGVGLFIIILTIGVVCLLYTLVSLVDRVRSGRTLIDLGPNPWLGALGTSRVGAASFVAIGTLAAVAILLHKDHEFNLGVLMLPAGLLMFCATSSSRITQRGIFVSGFLYSWDSVTWYALTPGQTWMLFGVRGRLTFSTLGQIHIPPGCVEKVEQLFEPKAADHRRLLAPTRDATGTEFCERPKA